MASASLITTLTRREEKIFANIGETAVCGGLAYLGTKLVSTTILPRTASIYMAAVWGIYKIAEMIFKNSSNKDSILFAVHLSSMFVVAYSVGITFLNGLLIEAITVVALACVKYLHRNMV